MPENMTPGILAGHTVDYGQPVLVDPLDPYWYPASSQPLAAAPLVGSLGHGLSHGAGLRDLGTVREEK